MSGARPKPSFALVLAIALVLAGFAALAYANHSWNGYH